MSITPTILPALIQAVETTLRHHQDEVTALDVAIGDGDHVINLQRGISVLVGQSTELATLDWPSAWQKIGMTLMSKVGGASGSLLGTLFVTMGKSGGGMELTLSELANAFDKGVEAMKVRGKSDEGEKTMLDVLIPVSRYLQSAVGRGESAERVIQEVAEVAAAGVESTRDMLATKGRASFLGERVKGHLDAGAKTSQLMICAIVDVLKVAGT
jgi:dihydroxyacetone kinase-like protein